MALNLLLFPFMRNIAIIDDNASERLVLKGLVQDSGYNIIAEGSNGAEAVEICRLRSPDLVIMDVKMPVKEGIEAASEISQTCPTPVILLTARDDEDTIKRAAEAGVMGYLIKPVRQEELAPAIELAATRFQEFRALRDENIELKGALQARKSIEKAKGLLMEREKITEAEAFARIRKISMDKRKSMTDIAEVIIMAFEKKGGV
ncbi:MAG: response regulator [Deltaproteobacteria bacterium]|nr:response regulator [Deltaproteobacteria bacterium]